MSDETDLNRLDDVNDPADLGDPDDFADAAAIEAAMAETRARLAEVPAEVVVVNHVMGLYELAAIHLSSAPPNLVSASLAIDAMALLVEGLQERLGEETPTMRDALANIRMAFVAVSSQSPQPG